MKKNDRFTHTLEWARNIKSRPKPSHSRLVPITIFCFFLLIIAIIIWTFVSNKSEKIEIPVEYRDADTGTVISPRDISAGKYEVVS